VVHAGIASDLQAQVGELHRDVGGEEPLAQLVEHADVVVVDRLGFGAAPHLLAQLGEHRAESGGRQLPAGPERGDEILARHEAAHRAARELTPTKLFGEPVAA
jgi:hypothetical protein